VAIDALGDVGVVLVAARHLQTIDPLWPIVVVVLDADLRVVVAAADLRRRRHRLWPRLDAGERLGVVIVGVLVLLLLAAADDADAGVAALAGIGIARHVAHVVLIVLLLVLLARALDGVNFRHDCGADADIAD
jgi:hypothetical protein